MPKLKNKIFSTNREHAYLSILVWGALAKGSFSVDMQSSLEILASEAPIEMKVFLGVFPQLLKFVGPIMFLDGIIDAFTDQYHLLVYHFPKYLVQMLTEKCADSYQE